MFCKFQFLFGPFRVCNTFHLQLFLSMLKTLNLLKCSKVSSFCQNKRNVTMHFKRYYINRTQTVRFCLILSPHILSLFFIHYLFKIPGGQLTVLCDLCSLQGDRGMLGTSCVHGQSYSWSSSLSWCVNWALWRGHLHTHTHIEPSMSWPIITAWTSHPQGR